MTDVQCDDLVPRTDGRSLRPWSVALAVLGPVLAVVALVVLVGFDLGSSTGGNANASEFLQVWIVAVVLGGLVPMAAAVVLAVSQLVVSTRAGDLFVDVEYPVAPPGHEASTLRLDAVTHCVVG